MTEESGVATALLEAEAQLAALDRELAWELTRLAADAAGIVDPTPVSDAVSMGMSLAEGDYVDAALSGVSMVPWAGDAVAKPMKAARASKKILALEREIAGLTAKIGSLKAKLPRSNGPRAIKPSKTKPRRESGICFPCALEDARQHEGRASGRNKHFVGGIKKGLRIFKLKNVKSKHVRFTKQAPEVTKRQRGRFPAQRKHFLKDLATDPRKQAQLRKAGLDDTAIAKMREGYCPEGWEVHHKHPLDGGGSNDFGNLVLVPKEVHITFTNHQRQMFGDLKPGEARTRPFPVPDGFIYPTTPRDVKQIRPRIPR